MLSTFHPEFTYPIFGDEERIFGYQGLRIHFRFASHDLRLSVKISYDKKFKSVGDTKATDIKETLKDWIPLCELLPGENLAQPEAKRSGVQPLLIVHPTSMLISSTIPR